MKSEMFNYSLYRQFVHPDYCKLLLEAGLKVDPSYAWIMRRGHASLRTHEFDLDQNYIMAYANLDFVSPPDDILPAFQLMDMEIIVPDYCHSRTGTAHTILIENIYKLPASTNDRLPDAFAAIVLEGIRKRIFDVQALRQLLQQKKIEY